MAHVLSPAEREEVFALAEQTTGACQQGTQRHHIIISNVERRLLETKHDSLASYLRFVNSNEGEYGQLISALTIHTTEWFRELPHFERLHAHVHQNSKSWCGRRMRVLCAACSTGEEAYSLGMVLETLRVMVPGFDWTLDAFDIDPVSIAKAKEGIYPRLNMGKIPPQYRSFLNQIPQKAGKDVHKVSRLIFSKIKFYSDNLINLKSTSSLFDVVTCRNVLIYFERSRASDVVGSLVLRVNPSGLLFVGQSETIDANLHGLQPQGNSIFLKGETRVA